MALILAACGAGSADDEGNAETPPELSRLLATLTEHVPGVAAAVATPEGIVWRGAAGWSEFEPRRPMQADRLFGIGSISKTFISVILHHDLVEVIERRIRQPAALDSVFLEGFEPVPEEWLAGRHHFATPDIREAAGVNAAFPELEDGLIDVSASNLSVEWAAGGMVASAGDLARYGVAIFDGTLLSDEALDAHLTFRPIQWSSPAHEASEPEPVVETGYGLFRRRLGEFRVLGHAGDVLGYSAWLYYEPTSQVALAVLANAGTMHAGPEVGAGRTILRDGRFIAAAVAAARASRGTDACGG